MSFKDLKRNSTSAFEKLNSELSKLNQNAYSNDDTNLWTCKTDKAGNGYAIIRFLPGPAKDGDDALPFVRKWSHGFKGHTGSWFIEDCLTTLGKECPVCEKNSEHWNAGEDGKTQARKQKRNLSYYSNIYVVKDPANPENEGKIFIYRYGKKIFDKLNEMMNPVEDPLDPKAPVNPFDFWKGANFKLKVRQVEGYPNYDKSEFDGVAALSDDDDVLEQIWKDSHSLKDLIDPSKFKSYDDQAAKLAKVIGGTSPYKKAEDVVTDDDIPSWSEAPKFKEKEAPAQKASVIDDDDEDLAFFKNALSDD